MNEEVGFDQIIWCTSERSLGQPEVNRLADLFGDYFTYVEGVNEKETDRLIQHGKKQDWPTVVVLNDRISFLRVTRTTLSKS